ncbi:methyltransferase domain-containing protein [Armatimonas sp.]|uniref:class I SAM-dependent methyltransferase n=1 Tax=Armatimonas sp. TaxID=1872638 RepID=UPI00286A25BB|nr:methyltransferase domain-containing protein [Armatimonas sp.]
MLSDYPLVTHSVECAGRVWELLCVTDQDALIRPLQTDEDLANFPFGILLWASAHALALRLADDPALVQGKRILEIGAGVGYVGLVAAHLGAAQVVQTDYHDDCLALCRENATRNQIANLTVQKGDWRSWPKMLTDFDLVIGADVLYERLLHPTLTDLLPTLGKEILLADPLRPAALEFFEQREAAGWQIQTEARRLHWAKEWRDIMLLWIKPSVHP